MPKNVEVEICKEDNMIILNCGFGCVPEFLKGCLYSLDWTTGLDYWTGLLDWTTGLTLELTFELFFLLLMINIHDIAVVLLAKVNLGVLGK